MIPADLKNMLVCVCVCVSMHALRYTCAHVEIRGQTRVLLLRDMVHLLQIQPLKAPPHTHLC